MSWAQVQQPAVPHRFQQAASCKQQVLLQQAVLHIEQWWDMMRQHRSQLAELQPAAVHRVVLLVHMLVFELRELHFAQGHRSPAEQRFEQEQQQLWSVASH
jgi:P2-related tail formation protein